MPDNTPTFLQTIPVLPALDINRAVTFYVQNLQAERVFQFEHYAGIQRDDILLHFGHVTDPELPKQTTCRIRVHGVESLHAACKAHGIVHHNGGLGRTPWGSLEFAILDSEGNCITFTEPLPAGGN